MVNIFKALFPILYLFFLISNYPWLYTYTYFFHIYYIIFHDKISDTEEASETDMGNHEEPREIKEE